MVKVSFKLEKVQDPRTGTEVDTLIKYVEVDGKGPEGEPWCNVMELDQLFSACASKWGSNWDLQKVIVAIQESEIL